MANNYKVKMKDIQNKYKFKIFCAGYEYDDTELRNAINQRALITEAGRYVELELNPNTYVLTAKLKDKNNTLISSSTPIDLPLESMIVDCDYDEDTKSLIITLQNGNTTSIPLGDLIEGLATEEDLNEVKNELDKYKTIYNVLPKVEDEGEALTLNDTGNATLKMNLKGNTSQEGEPTPSSPQEVKVVTGDNTIEVVGKNLYIGSSDFSGTWEASSKWETDTLTFNGCVVKKRAGSWDGLCKTINVVSGKTYTFSLYAKADESRNCAFYLSNFVTPTSQDVTITTEWTRYSVTFTANSNTTVRPRLENKTSSTTNYTYIACYQLEEGTLSDYEKTQSYQVNIGNIELCKMGTYQDYFYKDSGKWYKHSEIGKVDIDTSQVGVRTTYTNIDYATIPKATDFAGYGKYDKIEIICTSATYISQAVGSWDNVGNIGKISGNPVDVTWWLGFEKGTSLATIQTELSGSYILYPLATPTNTEITDTNLISQLNAIQNAMSYKGQTNISQINNDLPFIIDATALKDLSNL